MEIGKIWPGWDIAEYIGEGAYGKVYKITKEDFGHTYKSALKVITIPSSKGELTAALNDGFDEEGATIYFRGMVEDIVEEFVLMSQLRGNSNIVSYEDHAVIPHEEGIGWDIYIRMELLKPLFTHIKEHSLSIRDVINLGIDMCQALEVCQKYNIMHRDIKPENIFVSDIGRYKLGDFGIARQLEKTSALSRKGTYVYMAPEVYKGEEYNSTVDIYSLGIVLYRFLNQNRTPFLPPFPEPIRFSDKEKANILRFGGEKMKPPCNAKGRLAEIVLKACAYDPKERYESARDMREALQEILYSENEMELVYPMGDELENNTNQYASISNHTDQKAENISILKIDDASQEELGIEKTQGLFITQKELEKRMAEARERAEEEARKKEAEEQKRVEEEARKKEAEEKERVEEEARKKAAEEQERAEEEARKKEAEEKERAEEEARKKAAEEEEWAEEEARKKAAEEKERAEKEAKKKMEGEAKEDTNAKPFYKNPVCIALAAAVVIVAVIIIAFVPKKNGQTEVPDFSNMTLQEAEAAAAESGLVVQKSEENYSDTVKKGAVISQNIKAGTAAAKDSIVEVEISLGKKMSKVPTVVGLTEEEAKQTLEAEGFVCKADTLAYSESVEEGRILSQTPGAGASAEEKTVVVLVISKGAEPVIVPDVVGMTEQEAKSALKSAGLKVKVSEEEGYNDSVEAGHVVSQDVSSGESVAPKTKVSITISKGAVPEEEEEPQQTVQKPASNTTRPTQPASEPQQPATEPQQPATEPQQPASEPQQPATEPQQPSEPTQEKEENIDSWDLIN